MAADHLKKIDRPVTLLPRNQFAICNLEFFVAGAGFAPAISSLWGWRGTTPLPRYFPQ